MKKCDIVVVIPLEEEFRTFGLECPIANTELHDGVHYHALRIPDCNYDMVCVLLGGMGPSVASNLTEKALTFFDTQAVILVGLAGALDKDLRLGDVIVASEVSEFLASSKVVQKKDSFLLQYSGDHWPTDFALKNCAQNFEFTSKGSFNTWQRRVRSFRNNLGLTSKQLSKAGDFPEIRVGHVASGDSVSASEAYKAELKGIDRKFLALELESAGVLRSAHNRSKTVRTMVLRGISDFADERKASLDSISRGIWRRYAMYSATTLMLSILTQDIFREIIPCGLAIGKVADDLEGIAQRLLAKVWDKHDGEKKEKVRSRASLYQQQIKSLRWMNVTPQYLVSSTKKKVDRL